MKKLRIKLNLQHFFQDHRQFAMICLSENIQTVKDLEEYIRKVFNIDQPIYFLYQNHYLIPDGDIDVLRDEDQLYVFPLSETLNLQKINESFTQLETLLKERELQLSRYINKASERSSRKRKRDDIKVSNLVSRNKSKNITEQMDLDFIQEPEAPYTPAELNSEEIHVILEPDVVEKKDKKKKRTRAVNEVENNVESSTDDKKKNKKHLKEVNNNKTYKEKENQSKNIPVAVTDESETEKEKQKPIIVPENTELSSKKSKKHKTEKKKNILIKSVQILANIKTNTSQNHLQNALNNTDTILNNPIGETLPETIDNILMPPPSSDQTVPKENGLKSPLKSNPQLCLSDVTNSPSYIESFLHPPNHNSTEIENCVEPSPAALNPNDVSFNFEYEFVTKRRRRTRTRRRKGQSPIVEQTPEIIPKQFQPLRTQAAPIQHIKFEKDEETVITPATVSIKKDSIPEPPHNRTDIILKVDHDPTKYPLLDRKLQTHDLIYFKKYKMSENYTPEISNDILGYVENLSQCGTVAVLDVVSGQDEFKEPLGKFSMCEELAEEEQIEENNKIIMIDVNELIQPRLVTI